MIPCYNAKCGNTRRVTRVTEQAHIFELVDLSLSLSLSLRIYTLFCPDSVYT